MAGRVEKMNCADIAQRAEDDDSLIPAVVSLDWSSTIGSGETFIRSERLLESCWMCEAPGRYDGNQFVKCTSLHCALYPHPTPRKCWQSAGMAARICFRWMKRFWKLQGEMNVYRNGLDHNANGVSTGRHRTG
jgi:hypothetical protein